MTDTSSSDEKKHLSLGGARQSMPLDDEISYPLTREEFHILEDNLTKDNLTNLESFLFSTGIASAITAIVLFSTNPFTKEIVNTTTNEKEVCINYSNLIIFIIYTAVGLAALGAGFISKKVRKESKSGVERLQKKILKHYGE